MAYRVNETDAEGRPVTGLDLPAGRAEPGDVIAEAPAWLIEQGYVTETDAKPRKRKGR